MFKVYEQVSCLKIENVDCGRLRIDTPVDWHVNGQKFREKALFSYLNNRHSKLRHFAYHVSSSGAGSRLVAAAGRPFLIFEVGPQWNYGPDDGAEARPPKNMRARTGWLLMTMRGAPFLSTGTGTFLTGIEGSGDFLPSPCWRGEKPEPGLGVLSSLPANCPVSLADQIRFDLYLRFGHIRPSSPPCHGATGAVPETVQIGPPSPHPVG